MGLDIAAAEFTTLPPKYEDEVAFYTGLDIVCPVLLTIFQWPVPTTYTGTQTPAPLHNDPYKNPDQWGNKANLLPWAVSTGIAPLLIEAIAFVVTFFDSAAGDKMNDNAVPVITTVVSGANTVLSAWYAYNNATTDGEKTLAIIPPVISNLSYVDGILGSKFAMSQLPRLCLVQVLHRPLRQLRNCLHRRRRGHRRRREVTRHATRSRERDQATRQPRRLPLATRAHPDLCRACPRRRARDALDNAFGRAKAHVPEMCPG